MTELEGLKFECMYIHSVRHSKTANEYLWNFKTKDFCTVSGNSKQTCDYILERTSIKII